MPRDGGNPKVIEKQSRIWQLVLCSQHTSEDAEWSQKSASILGHRKNVCGCSSAKYNIIITSLIPKMKKCLTVQLTKSTKYAGASTPLEKPHATHGRSFSKAARLALCTSGQSRRIQELKFSRFSFPSGYLNQATCEGALSRRARTRRLRTRLRTISSLLHACQPLGQQFRQKVQGVQTHKVSARHDLRCGHEACAGRTYEVLPDSQRLRYLLRHDHQGVRQERYPHQGQGENVLQDSRRGRTHTVKKIVSDRTYRNDRFHQQSGNLLPTQRDLGHPTKRKL